VEIAKFSADLPEIGELPGKYGLVFDDRNRAQAFFDLLREAINNTRMWSNKGHSPDELFKMEMKKRQKDGPVLKKSKKIGPNEQCPCGSGKKYKKCCRLIEEAKTAQLSQSECVLFYETWYGLMSFVNERRRVINAVIEPVYPNPVRDEEIYKVRKVLWETPALIDEYLNFTNIPEEKVELLKSWRNHHKEGLFFIVDYKPEYAVAVGEHGKEEERLYGIKGISRSLADVVQSELPIPLETVLLPFNCKIIYDSFINFQPLRFGKSAQRAFREMYEDALRHGIITGFE
jgi:hypothetical protein